MRYFGHLKVLGVLAGALLLTACSGTRCEAAEELGSEGRVTANAGNDPKEAVKTAEALFARVKQYHRDRDWHRLADTLDQLLDLMPKDTRIRKFVAWNQSRNLSAEANGVEGRYAWIRRGLQTLMDGIKLDKSTADHWHNTGWDLAFGIGTREESRQYRRLFANDVSFHDEISRHVAVELALGPDGKPDNWLVGRLFFVRAAEMVQNDGAALGDSSPLFLFVRPANCRSAYASSLNKEGRFDDTAIRAWHEAERDWRAFGDLDIPTNDGFSVKLNELDREVADETRLWNDFDRLQPGLRERLRSETLATVPDTSRRAWEEPESQRTFEEMIAAREAEKAMQLTPEQLAKAVTGDNRSAAIRVGQQAIAASKRAKTIKMFRAMINFDAELLCCRWERSDVLIDARRATYEADQLLAGVQTENDRARRDKAARLYEKAFDKWAKVISELGDVANEGFVRYDVLDAVDRYRQTILNMAPLPDDFPIREKLAEWERLQR